MLKSVRRHLLGGLLLSWLSLSPNTSYAQSACDTATQHVALTGVIAAAAGAIGALSTSALAAELDDRRDYAFSKGALIGVGVSAGLASIYALVDGSSGCRMAEDGIAWSVPVTTFIVGAALPVALWGASDELSPADELSSVQDNKSSLTIARTPSPQLQFRWQF